MLTLVLQWTGPALAQCTDQVTHLQGSQVIDGINVTVTSTGIADEFWTYCAETFPYWVGADDNGFCGSGNTGTGSYTFQFDPPIAGAVLNVSGISLIGIHAEQMRLFVNGSHYAIAAPGSVQSCDPLADLTPDGDIAGCANCGVSGWGGTPVYGPITTLTVQDTVLSGSPGGAIFSLFICATGPMDVAGPMQEPVPVPYPNPAMDELFIDLGNVDPRNVMLFNAAGSSVPFDATVAGGRLVVSTSGLPRGLYALQAGHGEALHRIVLQ